MAAIGQGSSGDVYLAHDRSLGRKVAVKVLHTALAGDEIFLKRFRAEAKSAAALSHPSIMAVFDWGDSEEMPYLVCELLAGGSLREHFSAGRRFSAAQIVSIALQGASGLAYAHQRGYVHRDLKPANIIFDEGGRIRIADFGLARALSEAAWTEPVGVLIGTAKYASPEQARGQVAHGPSDVYSLGLVLYEAITGRLPFQGDTTLSTLMARVGKNVSVPLDAGPLREIVESCLKDDSGVRPTSVDLVRRLEELARQLDPAVPIAPLHKGPYDGADELASSMSDDTLHLSAAPIALPVEPKSARSFSEIPELFDLEVDNYDLTLLGNRAGLIIPQTLDSSAPFDVGEVTEFGEANATSHVAKVGRNGLKIASKERRKQRMWRGIVVWLVVTLILTLLAIGSAVFFSTVAKVSVPSLTGKSLPAAEATAARLGLAHLVTGSAYSSSVPRGDVLSTYPRAGMLVTKKSIIDLTLSEGHAPVKVPSLVGMNQQQISVALRGEHLSAVFSGVYSETVGVGIAMSSNPQGGATVAYGSSIAVVLSRGPAPRTVPNVVGDTQAAATAALNGIQLQIAATNAYSNTVASGQVISQSIPSGQQVARGTVVDVVISQGPHYTDVPNVLGDNITQATAALSAVGLNVGQEYVTGPTQTVVYSSPVAGTQVLYGSSVSLILF